MKAEGFIDKIFFTNEDNGVSAFVLKGEDLSIKVMGTYFEPKRGEYVECEGVIEGNKTYGDQLKASVILPKVPKITSGSELKRFLKTLASFDSDELYMISSLKLTGSLTFLDTGERPPELDSPAGAIIWDKVKEGWATYNGSRDIASFLIGHGINPSMAKKLYKVYKEDCIPILKENPYKLLDGFGDTVSFKLVDEIGLKVGIHKKDPKRLKAGIIEVLKDEMSSGHTFLPLVELLNKVEKFLSIPDSSREVFAELKEMRNDTLVIDKKTREDIRVSLSWVRKAETYCEEALENCLNTGEPVANTEDKVENIRKLIQEFEQSTSLSLSDEQREAILTVFTNKVSIITGNPGTGKTTVCKCILYILNKLNKSFSLASPTGRAAKRLAEVTGCFAETIHRLLEYSPRDGGFTINEENPLPTDYLLVDEFSMVDIFLFRHLLKGFDSKNNLILVGDADQLPSVQAGSVLRDCINSQRFGTKHLSKIYRQDDSNLIVLNAHAINKGNSPKLLEYSLENDKFSDFLYLDVDSPEKAVSVIEQVYVRKLKEGNTPDSIQILSPKKEGLCGIKNLNSVIQQRINGDSSKQSITKNGIVYRLGDRVLQLKNDYELGIFNGDTGVIVGFGGDDIKGEPTYLLIDFGLGQNTLYEVKNLNRLQLAYAMTIHKSQGSEYPIVIMPLLVKEHYIMLYRNLFYTGITRAKRKLYLVGQSKAVSIATKNVKNVLRYTNLFN